MRPKFYVRSQFLRTEYWPEFTKGKNNFFVYNKAMDAKKTLILLLLISIAGNLIQFFSKDNSDSYQGVSKVESLKSYEGKKEQKKINVPEVGKEVVSFTSNKRNSPKTPTMKEAIADDDAPSYEEVNHKTTRDIETFIIDRLNFNSQEASKIFQIIEKSEKKFEASINEKRKRLESKYDESFGYMYDPHDYIQMGKSKLEARELIKKLLGQKKFELFLQFVQDYNHGKYSESFVPIEI